ncbi:hypothetical protein ACGFZQ_12950 [Streptomyces sp. NPDC048254]|uniref:hypothetical protein n=1 Tax=Streptomyces sp. NPDC048254 TaxID=3365525 RepID=UPI0037122A4F
MAALLNFLPWVRQGTASVITVPDSTDPATPVDARVELPVALSLDSVTTATAQLRLYGPGDVRGLDTRQIIRTDPAADATDFESNYLAAIEFDRPDLPWVFTPAAHDGAHRLRPWLCLVVVPADRAAVLADPSRPLPYLRIPAAAGAELPDLAESWAWAHAQVVGGDIAGALDGRPERTLSRLVCPRRLEPTTGYLAAVVPAFDAGVAAGLGQQADDATIPKLKPAWDATTAAIDLPVYHHWEFATGERGDFEELVTRLQRLPGDQIEGLGTRPVEVDGLPQPVGFGGSLRPAGSGPAPAYPPAFVEALRAALGAPGVPPPLYGRWHAAQSSIPDPARDVRWLRELNLDVRLRTAAALGTRVVREQQEVLMASAWTQVGAIEQANQLLRQAQLARDNARTRFAALSTLPAATLVQLAGPALARILVDPTRTTAAARFAPTRVPLAMSQGPFRRAARSGGPVARRITAAGGTGVPLPARLLARANGTASLVPPKAAQSGMVSVRHALEAVFGTGLLPRLCEITPDAIRNRVRTHPPTSPALKALYDAAARHQARMAPCPPPEPVVRPPLDLAAIATAVTTRLDPERAVPALMSSLVTAPGWAPADPLAPVLAAPEFPTPMYRALAALSQEHILPGLERLPANSITAVETNRAFIAAYMVGLNHEMSRELLWREFPTDQRGTCFRQFWESPAKDIDRIDQWPMDEPLEDAGPDGGDQVVLLIRGDLIRRYANATVYVTRADWYDASDGGPKLWRRRPIVDERYPRFQGSLLPDVTFMGFALDPADALGRQVNAQGNPIDDDGDELADPVADDKAGWFVVFQQHPTEPRFGLDETGTTPATGWSDLSWTNVTVVGHHLRIGAPLTGFPAGAPWPPPTSAALAGILLQRPFRAAVHLSDLLGTGTS